MRGPLVAGLSLSLLLGCTSAKIAGGTTVTAGTEPTGVTLARFRMGSCRDARGNRLPSPDARVTLVRRIDGKVVLVERREGYDSIVVDNAWSEPGAYVFQLALKRASSAPYVREYRVPTGDSAWGRFAIVKDVRTWTDHGARFRARYSKAALECELAPE